MFHIYDPEDESFPFLLELFSRIPDALKLEDDSHLTPIPMGEAASSLSAILLDDAYYHFILKGTQVIDMCQWLGQSILFH